MPATGRAVRIVSGPRYRLVATFADGEEESSRGGFDSVPAAQAEVGAFVCDVAARGRPTSVRVERVELAGIEGNGKSHEPPAAVVTFKRWDETVIDRILRQRPGWEGAGAIKIAVNAEAASNAPPEMSPPGAVEAAAGLRQETPNAGPAAEWMDADSRAPEMHDSGERELRVFEDAEPLAPQQVATAEPLAAPLDETELAHLSGETSAAAPAVAAEPDYAAYRPRHRRTRWALILTAAFVAILVVGMLLLETNGDPVGYFRKLGSGETVRETLPFRNGDGPATKPAVGRRGP